MRFLIYIQTHSDGGDEREGHVDRNPELEDDRLHVAPLNPEGQPHVGEGSDAAIEAAQPQGNQQQPSVLDEAA